MNATLARLTQLTADPLPAGDGPLLDAFLAGDQSAFAALMHRYAGLVFATCRRVLRHQQDAEDAFQATFLVLAHRAADVWPREAVGSWLFGVAHRVALKARTARNRRTTRQQPLEEVAAAERGVPDCDLAEVVQRVVCRLPDMYRAAVVACDLEGLSRKEAAERLGWSEGTLSGRLARARDLLARRFRRIGLTLPAGGLVSVLGVPSAVSASVLQTTIELATGAATIGVSAPVAALTEGVVRSMAFFKFKTMTAVLFVACAVGFGAFAASGAGAGEGTGDGPGQRTHSQTHVVPVVPVAAMADSPAKQPAKPITDRDRLQGTWRVVGINEQIDGKGEFVLKPYQFDPRIPANGLVIEFTNNTMTMPYRDATDGWKRRLYKMTVDETKSPKTIDLHDGNKPIGRGIYEFTHSVSCATCHKQSFDRVGGERLGATWCTPGFDAAVKGKSGMRLALTIDGTRPAKFGGHGVIVFDLQRLDDVPINWQPRPGPRVELAQLELEVLRQELELATKGKIDPTTLEKLRARIHAAEALLASEQKSERLDPTPKLETRLAVVALQKAKLELAQAEAEVEAAHAQAELAKVAVARATKTLEFARERVKAAEKADAGAKPLPPVALGKDDMVFTVHVRTLASAEKVIRVKATGKETVLEGLVHAADDVSLKSDGVSVWVVRDKGVLPVDLVAITKNGETKTNYILKAGDQLFIQVKAGK